MKLRHSNRFAIRTQLGMVALLALASAAGTGCSATVDSSKGESSNTEQHSSAFRSERPRRFSGAAARSPSLWSTRRPRSTSLWDPPAGCAFATEVNRPEAVIALTLGKAATTLTLSTAQPETNFDTVLYVLPSCATSLGTALMLRRRLERLCLDADTEKCRAGTYYVVVDSAGAEGGQFGLSVTAQ
jgi:hypothetical protein